MTTLASRRATLPPPASEIVWTAVWAGVEGGASGYAGGGSAFEEHAASDSAAAMPTLA